MKKYVVFFSSHTPILTRSTGHQWKLLKQTFLMYFPAPFCFSVLQALPWAPSPRFWFLCSSFALGGLAMKGLRLPSLKSDVHSTCWFSKQLCPPKNQDKPLTLGSRRNRGALKRGWEVLSLSYQTLFLCLFILLPPYWYISVFFSICLIEANHSNLSECLTLFAWHVVEREPRQKSLKASVTPPGRGFRMSQIQSPISRWFHRCSYLNEQMSGSDRAEEVT